MPKEEKMIRYFGYGTNKSKEMIYSLIGRKPKGMPGIMLDYRLYVQTWDKIPKADREILKEHWNKKFKVYIAIKEKGASIKGMVWLLSKKELSYMDHWELTPIWYKRTRVKVIVDGRKINAFTEIMPKRSYSQKIQTKNYPAFIAPRSKMEFVGRLSSKDYKKSRPK